MKKYNSPEIDIIEIESKDLIATSSAGTETTLKDENDGIWDLNV